MLAFLCRLRGEDDVIRLLIIKMFHGTKFFWPHEYEHELHWETRFGLVEKYLEENEAQIYFVTESEDGEYEAGIESS